MSLTQSIVDIEYVQRLARMAGVMAITSQRNLHAELKADGSFVTEADRDIEQFVRARLAERYPDHEFLGEEFGGSPQTDKPLWAIDPIDGTTNMVTGLPLWGISLGLTVAGEPVAGVFYMPVTDEMFWGEKGRGSYCNGAPLKTPPPSELHRESTLGFTSTALKNLDTSELMGRIRCLGSIAADIAYTARGSLACIVGCQEGSWDIAATLCIAREAGCNMAYLTGDKVHFPDVMLEGRTRGAFVVAHPQMVSRMIELLG